MRRPRRLGLVLLLNGGLVLAVGILAVFAVTDLASWRSARGPTHAWLHEEPAAVARTAMLRYTRMRLFDGGAIRFEPDGIEHEWRERLNEEGAWVMDGPSTRWSRSGTMLEQGGYRNDLREGDWTFWNEDGSLDLARCGYYEDDVRLQPGGDLTGYSLADLLAHPGEDVWNRTTHRLRPVPAELQRRIEAGLLSDEDWRLLVSTELVRMRSRWPAGMRLGVWLRHPEWLRCAKITARALDPALGEVQSDEREPSNCGNCNAAHIARARAATLAELPASTRFLDLDVAIDQLVEKEWAYPRPTEQRRSWSGRLRLPVVAVETVERALPGTDDRRLSAAVERSFRASLGAGSEGRPACLWLSVGGTRKENPELANLAISTIVQLRHDERVVSEWTLIADCSTKFGNFWGGLAGRGQFEPVPPEIVAPEADLDGWDLRVVGVSAEVLPIWEADRWWSGSFVLPLEEALAEREDEAVRPRR